MGKIMRSGKVVVMLNGRYAGKKAVVVKTFDETGERKFGHAIVAGIARNPRRVSKKMTKSRIVKRSKVKPFVKFVNFNHVMPTRYQLDMDLKKLVDEKTLKNADARKQARKQLRKLFEERYLNQADAKSEKAATGAQYFFSKLRF